MDLTPEQVEALAAEVRALRRWKAEATTLFDGMQDLGRALGLPLGTLVTGPLAIEAAEALRATQRGEWRADGYEDGYRDGWDDYRDKRA